MSIAQQIMSNPSRYSIQELQQAMDNGLVPAYIAIPLIQDKTQKQQQMQMAMAGQNAPGEEQPTVAEEVLQQADWAKGIDALPSELPADGYAPGGIVAFEEGGDVPGYAAGTGIKLRDDSSFYDDTPDYESLQEGIASLAPYAEEEEAAPEDPLAASVRRFQALTANLPTGSADRDALRQYLAEQQVGSADRAKQAQAMLALKTAGDILGGTSQFGAVNIGRGISQNVPAYLEQERALQKENLQNLMAGAQLSAEERAQAMADITGGVNVYGKELEEKGRETAARARVRAAQLAASKERDTFGDRAVLQMADEAAQQKYGKPLSELDPGIQRTLKGAATREYATISARASMYGADVRTGAEFAGINRSLWNDSVDSVDKELSEPRSAAAKNLRKIAREQGPEAAARERQRMYMDRYNLGPSKQAPAQTPAGRTPAVAPSKARPDVSSIQGAPAGSTIGQYTSKGWEIKGPGGKLLGYAQ